ncbi:MAG: hypothetical protein AABZ10_07895, partial [Nitrospirota bacterium]
NILRRKRRGIQPGKPIKKTVRTPPAGRPRIDTVRAAAPFPTRFVDNKDFFNGLNKPPRRLCFCCDLDNPMKLTIT